MGQVCSRKHYAWLLNAITAFLGGLQAWCGTGLSIMWDDAWKYIDIDDIDKYIDRYTYRYI